MKFEIIDFHTHPFLEDKNNICAHREFFDMSGEYTKSMFDGLGVTKICGSVIEIGNEGYENTWEKVKSNNNEALRFKEKYKDFYVPGFHIHPDYVQESIDEIHHMSKLGVNLIGELVPYMDGWRGYAREDFSVLLDEAGKKNMIVSFHSMDEDEMDKMVSEHKDVVFVAAHPGEYGEFMRHIERMKMSENYYLDLSGYGLFRHGMLRRAIDSFGIDRILFGSDYPTCNPAMYIGGVLLDELITDNEKEKIFSLNAKKLLKL